MLASFEEDILYVGLASNLRRRFGQHLDTPEKVAATVNRRAILMVGVHGTREGGAHLDEQLCPPPWAWPVLNKVYSPTKV
ncbi:hypothetical protein [Mesorhizobium sp. M0060]|uniref:hypothetical protein n=1 Tax=Mesorhizobium sp. M0060 TaxID=2956866 RepID=UPI0033350AD1